MVVVAVNRVDCVGYALGLLLRHAGEARDELLVGIVPIEVVAVDYLVEGGKAFYFSSSCEHFLFKLKQLYIGFFIFSSLSIAFINPSFCLIKISTAIDKEVKAWCI